MGLEDLTGGSKYISDLVTTNPASSDSLTNQDDHTRGIKNVLQNSFSGVTGEVTATHTELNLLDGVTATTAELNILDGVTSTAAEINQLDGIVLDQSVDTTASPTFATVTATLIAGACLKDEDDMSSDSATHLASQQSIKAYVDSSTVVAAYEVKTSADSPVTLAVNTKYFFDLSGGAITATLPSVAASDDGKWIAITTNGSAATNNLTINRADTDTIGGDASYTIDVNWWQTAMIYDDTNTDWSA